MVEYPTSTVQIDASELLRNSLEWKNSNIIFVSPDTAQHNS